MVRSINVRAFCFKLCDVSPFPFSNYAHPLFAGFFGHTEPQNEAMGGLTSGSVADLAELGRETWYNREVDGEKEQQQQQEKEKGKERERAVKERQREKAERRRMKHERLEEKREGEKQRVEDGIDKEQFIVTEASQRVDMERQERELVRQSMARHGKVERQCEQEIDMSKQESAERLEESRALFSQIEEQQRQRVDERTNASDKEAEQPENVAALEPNEKDRVPDQGEVNTLEEVLLVGKKGEAVAEYARRSYSNLCLHAADDGVNGAKRSDEPQQDFAPHTRGVPPELELQLPRWGTEGSGVQGQCGSSQGRDEISAPFTMSSAEAEMCEPEHFFHGLPGSPADASDELLTVNVPESLTCKTQQGYRAPLSATAPKEVGAEKCINKLGSAMGMGMGMPNVHYSPSPLVASYSGFSDQSNKGLALAASRGHTPIGNPTHESLHQQLPQCQSQSQSQTCSPTGFIQDPGTQGEFTCAAGSGAHHEYLRPYGSAAFSAGFFVEGDGVRSWGDAKSGLGSGSVEEGMERRVALDLSNLTRHLMDAGRPNRTNATPLPTSKEQLVLQLEVATKRELIEREEILRKNARMSSKARMGMAVLRQMNVLDAAGSNNAEEGKELQGVPSHVKGRATTVPAGSWNNSNRGANSGKEAVRFDVNAKAAEVQLQRYEELRARKTALMESRRIAYRDKVRQRVRQVQGQEVHVMNTGTPEASTNLPPPPPGGQHNINGHAMHQPTAAGTTSGGGVGRRVVRPRSSSRATNRQLVRNAITRLCLAGAHLEQQKFQALEALDGADATTFIILLAQSKVLSFKGLFKLVDVKGEAPVLHKLYGLGPTYLAESEVVGFFKYNSAAREFRKVHSRSFGTTTDAVSIEVSRLKKAPHRF
ncbi:unnamed protein product [Chrysoparadoxa australica]